jgi:hypothetical protein
MITGGVGDVSTSSLPFYFNREKQSGSLVGYH